MIEYLSRYKNRDSFTLVELLVVIGILAILTAAVVIVLNPAELLKQSRDSKRTTDLANLNNAIKLLLTQNPDVNIGNASTVYLSLSDSSSTCGSYSLPALPNGWRYNCATAANYQKTDGTGWVPVNFSSTSNIASLPALPTDPQNTGMYYYGYISGGSWEITSLFESKKYAAKAQSDAGVDPERLEAGSSLALWKDPYGLAGYWPLDEGSGTATADKSGNGNVGTLSNGPVWYADSNCKAGGCLRFDGVDDNVDLGIPASLKRFSSGNFTLSAWFKTADTGGRGAIMGSCCSYPGLNLEIYTSGSMRYWHGDGTATDDFYGNAGDLRNGVWHHAVLVRDKGSNIARIYVDGMLDKTNAITAANADIAANIRIGSDNRLAADISHNGYIDDVRIYGRALSAAEVQAIYNATK